MKFSEYRYERPDVAQFEQEFGSLLTVFREAKNADDQAQAMNELNKLRGAVATQLTLVSIRHSVDTNDEFYKAEKDFSDETTPLFQKYITEYYEALVQSEFRPELEARFGKQLFQLAELEIKTFSPDIISDLQLENKLTTEYSKLIASAKIEFEGEERTLSQLIPFGESTDRSMRKRAEEARTAFMSEHEETLDRIYDDLVKVRTSMAIKLGFNNFVEMGYARMSRIGYNAEMVEKFRAQVLEHIVPVASKLKERQRKRIGVDELYYYDENVVFPTGNATPKGTRNGLSRTGRRCTMSCHRR